MQVIPKIIGSVPHTVHSPTEFLRTKVTHYMESYIGQEHGIIHSKVHRAITVTKHISHEVHIVKHERFQYVQEALEVSTSQFTREFVMRVALPPLSIEAKNKVIFDATKGIVESLHGWFLKLLEVNENSEECIENTPITFLRYNSGLTKEQKKESSESRIQKGCTSGHRLELMICTPVFGTGIDGRTVRQVIYVGGCRSLVEYVQ